MSEGERGSSARKIRVIGCIHGLDSDNPKNPTRQCHLPCQWRINMPSNNNCSWMLFDFLAGKGQGLTLREIGAILNTTHETVRNTEASAISKILKKTRSEDELSDANLENENYTIRRTKDESSGESRKIIDIILLEFFNGDNNES